MQTEPAQSLPKLFDVEKRQKFAVSESGEFIENVYREVEASAIIGKMVGRNAFQPHVKKVFTAADVVVDGMLYKRGSWFKTWKKRYFVLRRDIRALCYFESQDNLKLLGSIPLSPKSSVWFVDPNDADGFEGVIGVQSDGIPGDMEKSIFIRGDNIDAMRSWRDDIIAESLKKIDEDEKIDMWNAIFDLAPLVENSSSIRRTATVASSGLSGKKESRSEKSNDQSDMLTPAANPELNLKSDTQADIKDMAADEEEDTDDEDEGDRVRSNSSSNSDGATSSESASSASNKRLGNGNNYKRTSATENVTEEDLVSVRKLINSRRNTKAPKKAKKKAGELQEKTDKAYHPSPFIHPLVDRFESSENHLAGMQLSVRLQNICTTQDRIFAAIFAGNNSQSDDNEVASKSGFFWHQVSTTEVRTVTERPEYGANCIELVNMQFNVLQDPLPSDCKYIMVALYRFESDTNNNSNKSGNKLQHHHALAKAIVSLRKWNEYPIFHVNMKILVENPVDISSPILERPVALLGVVKLTSLSLAQRRKEIIESMGMKPYAEMLYSFNTNSGLTLSLEQLIVSQWGAQVAQAYVRLVQEERIPEINKLTQAMEQEELSVASELAKAMKKNGPGVIDSDRDVASVANYHERLLQAIENCNELEEEVANEYKLVLNHLQRCISGEKKQNVVIPSENGGSILRRSIWKKTIPWQYQTTNLNLHIMVTRHFQSSEIFRYVQNLNASSATTTPADLTKAAASINITDKRPMTTQLASKLSDTMHYVPTITLGCPAAHALKFHDGGLRRIFSGVDPDNRYDWMYIIQSPAPLKVLLDMININSKDASSLFGNNILNVISSGMDGQLSVLKKKFEIARRMDMCGSQLLGFAVTVIKTTLMLATQVGGAYLEALQRSLKIGFLISLESMLSTHGDELGMIEDLEGSCHWLSSVTVRFVVKQSSKQSGAPPNNPGNVSTNLLQVGKADKVSLRRDTSGRLVVDMEVDSDEVDTLEFACEYMKNFMSSNIDEKNSNSTPATNIPTPKEPVVAYNDSEIPPLVIAWAPLVGIAFTQGVNEMQTFANMSGSRDVHRQCDINTFAMMKLLRYANRYQSVLEYQLSKVLAECLDAISFSRSQGPAQTGSTKKSVIPKRASFFGRGPSQNNVQSNNNNNNNGDQSNDKDAEKDLMPEILTNKVLSSLEKLKNEALLSIERANNNPMEKHVQVLLNLSALSRRISSTVGILCKSGKDRTSMGVTLETTRSLVEELGVVAGSEVCQLLRSHGVRRMNVYANTGQDKFAFNNIQKMALPPCYRPPPGTHAGNVMS